MKRKKRSQADIAREVAAILGKKEQSTIVFLNNIIRGKRKLPRDWEGPLLKVTGCSTLQELRKKYPNIQLHDDEYEVKLVVEEGIGKVKESRLADILQALKTLRLYGIKVDITISTKE